MARRAPKVDKLQEGSIVYAGVFDPRFNNYKVRPILVLRVRNDGSLDGICITKNAHLSPPEHQVQIDEHPVTGLRHPSVVVCTWPAYVEKGQVRGHAGRLPKANLEAVLDRIRLLVGQGVISFDLLFGASPSS
jgi:hypothetical protein